jgi:CheY-like chemotaxis protein
LSSSSTPPTQSSALTASWLFIGDLRSAEFAVVRESAETLTNAASFATLAQAATATEPNETPTWIVIAEATPHEVDRDALAAVTKRWPLARTVRVVGSWCEAERRHGWSWPGAWRLMWHQWPAWLDQTLHLAGQGRMPEWLPTASEEECWSEFQANNRQSAAGAAANKPVTLVVGNDAEQRDWLAKVCTKLDQDAHMCRPDQLPGDKSISSMIVDVDFPSADAAQVILKCRRLQRHAPLVVLSGFPRAEDISTWKAAGATAVLAKPVRLIDLERALTR